MYVCGPTVYDHAHIGNFRAAVVFDLLFRILRRRYGAEAVVYARNVTDIDDKIIRAARASGRPIEEITRTGAFVGHCAEMCGTYHSMMNFEVRVVPANDFKAFLQQRMAGKTNAEALQAINQPPLAVTTHPFDTRRGELAPQPVG